MNELVVADLERPAKPEWAEAQMRRTSTGGEWSEGSGLTDRELPRVTDGRGIQSA
jgi:hypothetical protein